MTPQARPRNYARGSHGSHQPSVFNSIHSDRTNVRFIPITKITLHMRKILLDKYV